MTRRLVVLPVIALLMAGCMGQQTSPPPAQPSSPGPSSASKSSESPASTTAPPPTGDLDLRPFIQRPCATVDARLVAEIGAPGEGKRQIAADDLSTCAWTGDSSQARVIIWLHAASSWVGFERDHRDTWNHFQPTTVLGYPALELSRSAEPRAGCKVVVDVAPKQSVDVEVVAIEGESVCVRAGRVAEDVVRRIAAG